MDIAKKQDESNEKKDRTYSLSFSECFHFDASQLNPTPEGWRRKFLSLFLDARYSMTVLMRLSQYYHRKNNRFFRFVAVTLARMNQILNCFEHGADPKIYPGIILHHTGVCITSATVIESGVHLYRNTTFGEKDGGAPHVKKNAKIASHTICLGPIVIGEKSIIAPGAVVLNDVPSGKIVGGVPAKIIGDVSNENYEF